jgi:cytochrome c55X
LPRPRFSSFTRHHTAFRLIAPFVFLVSGAATGADQPSPSRQAALMTLLKHDCGSCHGLTMKGGLGPSLLPDTLAGKDEDALAAIILDGVPGKPMPPWRFELRPEEARWLIDRLREGLK